jgi:hypothetical protein
MNFQEKKVVEGKVEGKKRRENNEQEKEKIG